MDTGMRWPDGWLLANEATRPLGVGEITNTLIVLAFVPTAWMGPADDDDNVEVVRDRRRDFGDRVVRIRLLRVPESEKFPEGIKYGFHFGKKGEEKPILRYDNHHGVHERHEGDSTEAIDFPGTESLLRRFIEELPDELSP